MLADAGAPQGGNRTAAARELGLDPANLHRLMKRLGQAPA
jgi:transcriptional regulator with GAF, ATPase, and Fis domain